ncbi:LuxR family transcriptional regulator [Streptomyces sp. NPDC054861]
MAVPVDEVPVLERARGAGARESWAEAYALLREADLHPSAALGPNDLDVLADAAWWTGRVDESVAARLRAQAGYAAAGDRRGAGRAAWWLAYAYRRMGRPAAAAGWLHRARHLLEEAPDGPEQCYPAWSDAEEAQAHHDPAAALAAARRMERAARRSGSPDLIAQSLRVHAAVLLVNGRRARGLALLDEAMGPVTAGALSGLTTGRLYALALTHCLQAADLPRAMRWTDAAMAWCSSPGPPPAPEGGGVGAGRVVNPFRGVCRVRRVEVLDLLGEWGLAEAEAGRACAEVLPDEAEAAAAAHYAAGEIRRRQGRLDDAVMAYSHAHDLGRVPQPGLALLRLAQGRTDAAVAGLRLAEACREVPLHDLLGRAGLLAARTEVALAVGDPADAARAAAELTALADGAPLLVAMAGTARGALALALGEPALPTLRRALARWRELPVPYGTARARMLLAAAERAAGDEEAARRQLTAARTTFEALGAVPDAARAAARLSEAGA